MSWNRSFVPEKKPMIGVIRKAYDMGVTFFDTAEAYGPFENEKLVGQAITPFRKDIILQENLWSADIELSAEALKTLTQEFSKIKIVGDRYATPQTRIIKLDR